MLKAEYSLSNVIDALEMIQDAKNPNPGNAMLANAAHKYIIDTYRNTGEFTMANRERLHEKYYLQMKNK